jgi:hypothetical protein
MRKPENVENDDAKSAVAESGGAGSSPRIGRSDPNATVSWPQQRLMSRVANESGVLFHNPFLMRREMAM